MLHGQWEAANTFLNTHQKEFGPSLWAMGWLLMLAEESRGAQLKLSLLKEFGREEFGKTVPIFARFFCISCDNTTPEESFRSLIRDCLPKPSALRQMLELIFLEDIETDWRVSEMLEYAEILTLIDRYELFVRLVPIAAGDKHDEGPRLCRAAARVGELCSDPYLEYIAEVTDDRRALSPDGYGMRLISAWDAYMSAKYNESLRIAADVLVVQPDILAAHELLVKSAMYLGKTEGLNGTKPLALLWQNLCNVLSKNAHSEDSLDYLQRFGRRYRIPPLTQALRALHASHSSYMSDNRWQSRSSYALAAHGPRNFEYGHPIDLNKSYLNRLVSSVPQSTAVRFFDALSKGVAAMDVSECDEIPEIRRLFFGGLAAARRGRPTETLDYLARFLSLQKSDSLNPLSPFAIEEARRALVETYRIKGDIINLQREVVNTFLDRPQSVRRLPIRQIYEACLANKNEACLQIEFPIIAYLASDDPHEIYLELRRFMRAVGVTKPSELSDERFAYDTRILATLFLRVCTPEVIDSVDVLDTVEKVEAERLLLLRWVSKEVTAFGRIAETEVLRLTQHAQLREALERIEGARVVVNVTALREAEQERFSDAYFRFVAQRDLITTHTDELVSAITALTQSGGGVIVIPTDALASQRQTAFKAFAAAFRKIRDAFLSSPHFGIEACLSGRIRHGVVIQHIRRPFVEKRLAVSRDSSERLEIENFWRQRLYLNQDRPIRQVMEILFKMTAEVNAIAEEVKGTWLHSKTETRNPKGMFDYSFTDEQLENILSTQVQDTASLDTFLDRIFDVLLERTRSGMLTVKQRIDSELRDRLRAAVDEAISKVPDSLESPSLLSLRNDLVASRQETERTCAQMALWFQEADATLMGDANFDLVARTAVGMVERLNPHFRGKHNVQVSSPLRIRGRYFTGLVHIVFFMLDNAIRHSNVPRETFESKISVHSENLQAAITVQSRMSSPEAAVSACRKIAETVAELGAALDPAKVIKEGGSGFAKMIAAVRYEFKQMDPGIIATTSESKLFVSVSLDMANLVV
jgi:hypothetical protein